MTHSPSSTTPPHHRPRKLHLPPPLQLLLTTGLVNDTFILLCNSTSALHADVPGNVGDGAAVEGTFDVALVGISCVAADAIFDVNVVVVVAGVITVCHLCMSSAGVVGVVAVVGVAVVGTVGTTPAAIRTALDMVVGAVVVSCHRPALHPLCCNLFNLLPPLPYRRQKQHARRWRQRWSGRHGWMDEVGRTGASKGGKMMGEWCDQIIVYPRWRGLVR